MNNDLISLAGYMLATFGTGYGLGLIIMYIRKVADLF